MAFTGQPRMRLWIEVPHGNKVCNCKSRSASYEAVNWSKNLFAFSICLPRSASYEAVNWSYPELPVWPDLKGQPRMRLWIEVRILLLTTATAPRSASYEAVNWSNEFTENRKSEKGQPRMRLWIEVWRKLLISILLKVSLVWGCELKCCGVAHSE